MRRGGPTGPLATRTSEPGQARKGAAVVGVVCAGVWLVGFTTYRDEPLFLLV